MLNVGSENARAEARAQWRVGMHDLAKCENVVVKLEGVGMDGIFGTGWSNWERPPSSDEAATWWQDDIRFVIDMFGPSWSMFELRKN